MRGHFILDETDKRRYAIYIGFEEIGAMQIMYSKEVQVTNQVGLYARPATFFIQKANEFKSTILVEKEERRVNAKSLLGILSLGITKGTTINLIADGPDEEEIQYSVAQIKEATTKLPAGYRIILSLYLFEGYDMEEIASILKIQPPSVRSQYLRAKRKLLDIIAAN